MEYDGKEFNDPIVRCADCQSIIHRIYLAKEGGCHNCGNRRVKNVLAIKPDEMREINNGTIDFQLDKEDWYPMDPEFLALFKAEG